MSSRCHTPSCDTKDLGCFVSQELCWSLFSSVRYLKKDAYGSESFWSAAGSQSWQRHAPLAIFESRGCISVYNATFRDRRIIHWPEILRTCKVKKLLRWILRKKLTDAVLTRSSKPFAWQFCGLKRFGSDGFWQCDFGGLLSSWPRSYSSYHRQDFNHTDSI